MGAMSAVSVRHERRKKHRKNKRPKKLLVAPHLGGPTDGTMSPYNEGVSRCGSRAGSPTHGPHNGKK